MMGRTVTGLLLGALLAGSTACGEPAPSEEPRTDETTSALLSASPRSAEELADMPAGALPPGSPRVARPTQEIDLASLGVDFGERTAPVRVIEMSDYGCGYCRQFHLETWPVVLRDFIEAGKVEWKFLPFVNGMFPNSPDATAAAECVLEQGADLFSAMDATIWERQREWKGASDPAPMLRGWAEEAGADVATYDSCLSSGRRNDRMATADALSRQAGVRGTPTFFIVGFPPLQGALPTETFVEVLDRVYEVVTTSGG